MFDNSTDAFDAVFLNIDIRWSTGRGYSVTIRDGNDQIQNSFYAKGHDEITEGIDEFLSQR